MSEKSGTGVNRRTVLQSAGAVAVSLSATSYAAASRKRFAIVGVGSRARMYLNAISGKFRDANELVAVVDNNAGRAALTVKSITATGASKPKAYAAADFDRMIRETKPQTVIVT